MMHSCCRICFTMLCGFDCIYFGFKIQFENGFGNNRMWKEKNLSFLPF
jgi:hypothetical protein